MMENLLLTTSAGGEYNGDLDIAEQGLVQYTKFTKVSPPATTENGFFGNNIVTTGNNENAEDNFVFITELNGVGVTGFKTGVVHVYNSDADGYIGSPIQKLEPPNPSTSLTQFGGSITASKKWKVIDSWR